MDPRQARSSRVCQQDHGSPVKFAQPTPNTVSAPAGGTVSNMDAISPISFATCARAVDEFQDARKSGLGQAF